MINFIIILVDDLRTFFILQYLTSVATERDEWVIGKMAASGPWVADSSALVALAVPPNHIFDLSDPEDDKPSKASDSSADGRNADGGDDDDEWSDDDDDIDADDHGVGGLPPAGANDGGYATHVAQGLRDQQGAGMRARPLTEIDPLEAATSIPLQNWTALLLIDDHNDHNDHNNDDLEANAGRIGSSGRSSAVGRGRLTRVAVPWVE